MTYLSHDAYGHIRKTNAPTLPCIALSNSPSTTVGIGPLAASGTGGAGAGSTAGYVGGTGSGASAVDTLGTAPNDVRGQFIVTTAGTPAAGLIAQVNFTEPYGAPVQVNVSAVDTTASPVVSVPVGVVLNSSAPGTTAGFQIASSASLTTAHVIQITYSVQA